MSKKLFGSWVHVLLGVSLVSWGCSSDSRRESSGFGTVKVPLTTTSYMDRVFALCDGTFKITNTGTEQAWSIDVAEHAAELSISLALPTGSYQMGLFNWSLCEATNEGLVPVDATLQTQVTSFYISSMQTTYVEYSFMVAGVTVTFGGQIEIRINVYEGSGAAAGAPSWNGSYESLYGACVLSCSNEHATARYIDPSGGEELSCARADGSSCSTFCSYEVGRYNCGYRGCYPYYYPYPSTACAEAMYRSYLCGATGTWTCVATPSGTYQSQMPAGCSLPSNCGTGGAAGSGG